MPAAALPGDPTNQPPATPAKIRLETRQPGADGPRPVGDPLGSATRLERPDWIRQTVLEDLGHLDPADSRPGAASEPEIAPGRERLCVATEPTKEPGTLDEEQLAVVPAAP